MHVKPTAVVLALSLTLSTPSFAQSPGASWSAVEQAFGRTAIPQPGDVMRFNFPRRDLRVMVGDVQLRPPLALGSWIAFKRIAAGQTMAMGDLVLTNEEINPVIAALQAGGVEQSALHNHIIGGSPNTMYLHISAHGNEVEIARAIRRALERTKTPLDTVSAGPAPAFELDTSAVAKALGNTGRVNGGVYQVNVPRAERITENGHEVPASMGLGTVLNFQPTGNGRAAITGDFVLLGSEVNPVIRALGEHGIGITALHSHMIGESPRLFFMHFWANANAVELARGLRAALDKTNSRK